MQITPFFSFSEENYFSSPSVQNYVIKTVLSKCVERCCNYDADWRIRTVTNDVLFDGILI